MDIKMNGLLDNLSNKDFKYEIELVLEGGCMNGAYEVGGLLLLKQLERKKMVTVNRISGASVGAFIGLLYAVDKLECYTSCYKEWRERFNETIQLKSLEDLLIKVCSEMDDDTFKSLQKNKIFITYYDVKTRSCILKKEYESREELWETVLKSCHLPYLINGELFYKTEDGEYLDGGLPYIFKIKKDNEENKILYMKLTQSNRLGTIFNVCDENNLDGRVLEGLLDTYKFFMSGKQTDMCSFVNDWGFLDMLRYNIIDYIYWFLVYFIILTNKVVLYFSPSLIKTEFYNKFSPIGKNLYKTIVRYMVFN